MDKEKANNEFTRTPLTELSISGLPFQLVPGKTYASDYLERTLSWQRDFALELGRVTCPSIEVFVCLDKEFQSDAVVALESLATQSYPFFSVACICPKGDLEAQVEGIFVKLGLNGRLIETDDIHVGKLSDLTSSGADYVVLLPVSYLLHPEALFIWAKTIIKHSPDFVYSNELICNENFNQAKSFLRRAPIDKYSLLSTNVFGGVGVFFKDWISKIDHPEIANLTRSCLLPWALGGLAVGSKARIEFVPLGAYLRSTLRQSEEETAIEKDESIKIGKFCAGQVGVPSEQIECRVECETLSLRHKLSKTIGEIQVIIPFKDNVEITIRCLASLRDQENFSELELWLVDNGSCESERHALESAIDDLDLRTRLTIIDNPGYFNFAKLNNLAASHSSTAFILFLNNDVILQGSNAINELKSWCALPDVGMVGGLLLYEDGQIQHAGINFSAIRPYNVKQPSEFGYLFRETNAVTFAMALCKRKAYEEIKGLDEFLCPNGFGDAVFCRRVSELGWKILFTPRAVAIHMESASRGERPEELELLEMARAGVPIADMFADFYAEHQPMQVNLTGYNGVNRQIYAAKKAVGMISRREWGPLKDAINRRLPQQLRKSIKHGA